MHYTCCGEEAEGGGNGGNGGGEVSGGGRGGGMCRNELYVGGHVMLWLGAALVEGRGAWAQRMLLQGRYVLYLQ